MNELAEYLKSIQALKSPGLISAFGRVDRRQFVPEDLRARAYDDTALPIGCGQTISQPSTVAFMLELLNLAPGQKILDIGFGSGWTVALLAEATGGKGKVFGVEILPEIFFFGERNLKKYSGGGIELFRQSGNEGLPEFAPYDRILVSAAADEVPQALFDQLAIGGRMVIPIRLPLDPNHNQVLRLIIKNGRRKFEHRDYPGFVFVPFVK